MNRIQAFFNSFFAWLPSLIGAIVIVIIAYIIARLVAAAIRRLGHRMQVDQSVEQSVVGDYKRGMAPDLSVTDLLARVVFWFVFGTGILLALGTLRIPLLNNAIGDVVAYLPNVVAAILILVVAVAIAGAVAAFAKRLAGDTTLGRIVGTAVPIVVIGIAIAMALVQLKISPAIVVATYVILLGAVGLGMALAFGLGGREVAGDILGRAYGKGQEQMPQLRYEAQKISDRAGDQLQEAQQKIQEQKVPQRSEEQEREAAELGNVMTLRDREAQSGYQSEAERGTGTYGSSGSYGSSGGTGASPLGSSQTGSTYGSGSEVAGMSGSEAGVGTGNYGSPESQPSYSYGAGSAGRLDSYGVVPETSTSEGEGPAGSLGSENPQTAEVRPGDQPSSGVSSAGSTFTAEPGATATEVPPSQLRPSDLPYGSVPTVDAGPGQSVPLSERPDQRRVQPPAPPASPGEDVTGEDDQSQRAA